MSLIAETDRLRLRRFAREDADFIVRLLNAPGFVRNIGDRGVRTADDGLRYLEDGPLKNYDLHGFGLVMVEELSTGRPLGMAGLTWKPWLSEPDLGYAMLPDAEGRGYASEAARAVLQFAFGRLKLECIQSVVLPQNEASIRILVKLGFIRVGTAMDPASEQTLDLLEKTAQG